MGLYLGGGAQEDLLEAFSVEKNEHLRFAKALDLLDSRYQSLFSRSL